MLLKNMPKIDFKKININNFKKIFQNKKSLTITCIILAVLLVAGGFLTWYLISQKSDTTAKTVTGEVSRGDINNVIEGSGTVEPISQYEITSLAKGDVIEDYFEEGDYVEKDQLLYKIDSASVDKSITKQQSSVEKARMNYSDAAEKVTNLRVTSNSNGVISALHVTEGDSVKSGTVIADVINKDTLVLTLPFGKFDAKNIHAGEAAEVVLANSLTTLYGVVKRVASGTYVNSYGVEVTDVEIQVENPGSVTEGESATAMVGPYACYDAAKLEYTPTKAITAKSDGEVVSVLKGRGDRVQKGEAVVVLESDSVVRSRDEARMSLNDANLSLEDLYDNLDDYSIKSPINGKVIQKNIKAGEKMDSNSSSTMAIIADLSSLTFDISIDELDISKISVGQEVTIQADALPNQTFIGEVSNISIVGSAYQGVTSYPVTVTINNTENSDLIPGMNVEAQIIVDSAKDVLRVPVSAVRMGNLVIVKDDGTFADPLEMEIPQIQSNNTQKRAENPNNSSKTSQDDKEGNAQEDRQDSADIPQRENIQTQRPNGENMAGRGQFGQRPGMQPDAQSAGAMPKTEEKENTQQKTESADKKPTANSKPQNAPDLEEMQKQQKERMKSMIDSLDVPDGYTVVRVVTGLNDGTYVEIKEIEGSLKEGDKVLLPVVSTGSQAQNGMPSGMGGGMPGGMGGGMPAGMGGGMSAGMGGAMSGSNRNFGGNRQMQR